MRVFDQHPSGLALDPVNAPRGVAQQHDVASVALHGEVLVDRADGYAFGLGDDRE